MALDSFSKDEFVYYELFVSCPVCQSRGHNTPQTFWQHHGCGGRVYVGDDAHFFCKRCGEDTHLSTCSYVCPMHSGCEFPSISYHSCSVSYMPVGGSIMLSEAGLPWFQKILENLGGF